jgi:peroxiredoxin
LLAISVDEPSDSKRVVEKNSLPFPILSDEKREIIRAYGVVYAGGGPGGSDIAVPAHFLIAPDGRIRWQHIATRIADRPDPAWVIDAIRAL